MKWMPLPGLVDWIDGDLLAQVARRRRQDRETKRFRKLGTVEMVWLMLAVALDTGRSSLHDILRTATADLGVPWSVTIGAFCKARGRFSPPASAVPSRTADPEALPKARERPGHVEGTRPQSR